jgi:hypothetical protein
VEQELAKKIGENCQNCIFHRNGREGRKEQNEDAKWHKPVFAK